MHRLASLPRPLRLAPPATPLADVSARRAPARRHRLVHVSDVHFGSPGVAERAEALLAALAAFEPAVVAVSGDLTRRATVAQFREARRFLDAIDAPTVVVPGNHDVPLAPWVRFGRRHARFLAHVADEVAPFHVGPGLAVAGLDTTRGFAIDGGRARRRALARLAERLAAVPRDTFRVVVAHHPFTKQPPAERRGADGAPRPGRCTGVAVQRARRGLAAFEAVGVDALLTGHRHETIVTPVPAVDPRVARAFLWVQAGTATTARGRRSERGRNSFVTLDVGPDDVLVTRHVLDPALGRFVAEAPRGFRRPPPPPSVA